VSSGWSDCCFLGPGVGECDGAAQRGGLSPRSTSADAASGSVLIEQDVGEATCLRYRRVRPWSKLAERFEIFVRSPCAIGRMALRERNSSFIQPLPGTEDGRPFRQTSM